MNYVLVNGSPKGENSVTLMIARKFLEGTGAANVDEIDLSKHPIQPCRGCMACWKTHGDCIIKDDMRDLWMRIFFGSGDPITIIWSFPLYVFGMPSNLKALFDRRFSFTEASQKENKTGGPTHPIRSDLNKLPATRNILISSCGFYTVKQNYEGLLTQFKYTVAEENYERILLPMAGAVAYMKDTPILEKYFALVKQAGSEYDRSGAFAQETRDRLAQPLMPEEQYLSFVNKWAASL